MITLGGDAELELVDSLDPFSGGGRGPGRAGGLGGQASRIGGRGAWREARRLARRAAKPPGPPPTGRRRRALPPTPRTRPHPPAEGILFSVRPPKKSWKNIANLSGGEKTLSSLSLVFALHHYKPTPLYVMDEIDAALGAPRGSLARCLGLGGWAGGATAAAAAAVVGWATGAALQGACPRRRMTWLPPACWPPTPPAPVPSHLPHTHPPTHPPRINQPTLQQALPPTASRRLQERVHRGPLHQGAHQERAVRHHLAAQQHVRAGRPPGGHLQGAGRARRCRFCRLHQCWPVCLAAVRCCGAACGRCPPAAPAPLPEPLPHPAAVSAPNPPLAPLARRPTTPPRAWPSTRAPSRWASRSAARAAPRPPPARPTRSSCRRPSPRREGGAAQPSPGLPCLTCTDCIPGSVKASYPIVSSDTPAYLLLFWVRHGTQRCCVLFTDCKDARGGWKQGAGCASHLPCGPRKAARRRRPLSPGARPARGPPAPAGRSPGVGDGCRHGAAGREAGREARVPGERVLRVRAQRPPALIKAGPHAGITPSSASACSIQQQHQPSPATAAARRSPPTALAHPPPCVAPWPSCSQHCASGEAEGCCSAPCSKPATGC